ncbi:PREDICTED: uncharacterized protein LOC105452636 [Wasmannia auropunctata]|uniref:uncharacterized protein LOC105452636 n=1 Tax=Wasmannia auropunctata TaxID=64793 RepID=UPI0005EE405D|nr:PREDICTED: uncharacterized protein LOC105452636 [Wasmannia auropunctata]XP_011692226.1 PREDICTED: uncharacterized protein LOC105452636 [Wasmannia auropunctata]
MAMAWLKILFYYILCTVIVITAQYTSDSEYNDFDFYEDLSADRSKGFNKKYNSVAQDDFYIANDFDDTENQNHGMRPGSNYAVFGNNIGPFERDPFDKQFNWYKLSEKVYRYTKHRIPGYDYDEFDYMRSRNVECDNRSIWTHCLCQFTCSKPDVVDCYTPCRSGCECKEEYVFDEKAQRCLLPEECSTDDYNYNY